MTSTAIAERPEMAAKLESVLIAGDLSGLNSEEKVSYYKTVCESAGLNPLTKPFEYLRLNHKLTLYALKGCTDQLRSVHNVSIELTEKKLVGDVFLVSAKARKPDGRVDESTGAVPVNGLSGEKLANAYMKAETKAKRRVTLSICGLGLLDETEVETIPGAETGDAEKFPSPEEAAKQPATPDQIRGFHILCSNKKWTKDQAKELLYAQLNTKSSKQWNVAQYQWAYGIVQKYEPGAYADLLLKKQEKEQQG